MQYLKTAALYNELKMKKQHGWVCVVSRLRAGLALFNSKEAEIQTIEKLEKIYFYDVDQEIKQAVFQATVQDQASFDDSFKA